jgi:hypothetical protein
VEREKAAYVIVREAQRKVTELNLTESGIRDYKQVLKLYPDTQAAEQARQCLQELGIRNKENDDEKDKMDAGVDDSIVELCGIHKGEGGKSERT